MAHDVGGVVSLRTHLVEGRDYASLLLVDHLRSRLAEVAR
ncbi:hypothetical protein SAMN05216377_10863 [Pseudonocardia oroxyli]|uniref:Uncharacterized protein n=1 Tax=Pseudonocardia oroxyli TaxID=366584 RepID=A0A1G7QGN1_PSEOR|nr:hypothetical protein SAMN05216377_10863 [Pseudonocardia oroxyli]